MSLVDMASVAILSLFGRFVGNAGIKLSRSPVSYMLSYWWHPGAAILNLTHRLSSVVFSAAVTKSKKL